MTRSFLNMFLHVCNPKTAAYSSTKPITWILPLARQICKRGSGTLQPEQNVLPSLSIQTPPMLASGFPSSSYSKAPSVNNRCGLQGTEAISSFGRPDVNLSNRISSALLVSSVTGKTPVLCSVTSRRSASAILPVLPHSCASA